MTRQELLQQIDKKKSVLCVGLDTDLNKIPPHLLHTEDPTFEFNKAVIDATHEFAVAYKPNIAFYESDGLKGWQSLEKTIAYINANYPEIFTIADAKRGDIGNTSKKYAEAFFTTLNFDSITVAPYMGEDSVSPFLEYPDKWAIVLALTSNSGALDFQFQDLRSSNHRLFEQVLETCSKWGSRENLMYVVGATKSDYIKAVREIVPDHFLLVPGVGAQGGNLEEVMTAGIVNEPCLLINSSRGIIYASQEENFQESVFSKAFELKKQMEVFL